MLIKKIILIFSFLVLFTQSVLSTNNKGSEPQKIRTGFSIYLFKDVDIRDATVAIKMWGDELLKNLGMNFSPESKIYETNDDIINALNNNELELISISTLDYFEIAKKAQIEPSLITTIKGNPGDVFILVVRKESNYKNIESLNGKTILRPGGAYGKIIDVWISNLILEKNRPVENYFSEVRTVEKPSQALLPVFFKQADACVVTESSFLTMKELNPQISKELIAIELSPIYPNGLMCINKNISPELKTKIVSAAKTLSQSVSGKQILTLFKAENVVDFKEEYIEGIKKANIKYQKVIK